MSSAMRTRTLRAIANFNGIDYEMDLRAARVALVHRQVEGDFHQMGLLADAVGCSRSTVSKWFSGGPTSLPMATAILAKLKLEFGDVYRRCPDDAEV